MNIILVGMPGAGKSTVGVLVAKALGMDFIDTDILIQQREGRLLQEIIDDDGIETFLKMEEKALLSLKCRNSVIATGGSAVYSDKAMRALRKDGVCVYLRLGYDEIERRLKNIRTRGIVIKGGQTLKDVYDERLPLYLKYSDVEADCSGLDVEQSVGLILAAVSEKK